MGGSERGNSELGDEVVVVGAVTVKVGVSATQLQNEKREVTVAAAKRLRHVIATCKSGNSRHCRKCNRSTASLPGFGIEGFGDEGIQPRIASR